jgi:hypothetical protein
MARQHTDHLFKLIKSLTKAEKRNFKLYVKRLGDNENVKFLKLFDIIDKLPDYFEDEILKKAPEIKPSQLPNLKANLTKNLLTSLRLMAQHNDIDIMMRQQLDYAKILYNKALYRQSIIRRCWLAARRRPRWIVCWTRSRVVGAFVDARVDHWLTLL